MPKIASKVRGDSKQKRRNRAKGVIEWMTEVPDDWISIEDVRSETQLGPISCSNYQTLIEKWRQAIRWRDDMDDVLSVMLAVAASTIQQGDQLFLMVVGNASGGKSQFCDGFNISKYCYQLEYLTGFFSGYKDKNEKGKDFSLINRVNTMCMITSEGDVLMSNPNFVDIMAKSRRLFDGKASATYKNLDEDRFYNWIRLTWIIAGTYAMLEKDHSSLGDRFLKIFVKSPEEDERRKILKHAGRNAWQAVRNKSEEGKNLNVSEVVDAQRMTGGYIDWLRDNTEKLNHIQCENSYFDQCESLALLVSMLRARPAKDEESEATKEEPNRLHIQFVRLMSCLTMVLNKSEVDDEVMRRVKKVAFDTGYGVVQDIVRLLYSKDSYISSKAIALYLDRTDETIRKILRFLRRLGVVELLQDAEERERNNRNSPTRGRSGGKKVATWGLTPYVVELCEEVM